MLVRTVVALVVCAVYTVGLTPTDGRSRDESKRLVNGLAKSTKKQCIAFFQRSDPERHEYGRGREVGALIANWFKKVTTPPNAGTATEDAIVGVRFVDVTPPLDPASLFSATMVETGLPCTWEQPPEGNAAGLRNLRCPIQRTSSIEAVEIQGIAFADIGVIALGANGGSIQNFGGVTSNIFMGQVKSGGETPGVQDQITATSTYVLYKKGHYKMAITPSAKIVLNIRKGRGELSALTAVAPLAEFAANVTTMIVPKNGGEVTSTG